MTGGHHHHNNNNHNNNHHVESTSWLELESDPGLFTLLVDDFGVKGVQVEEIYDLTKPLDNSIFGFIFLFKWIERRNRRSKTGALEPNSNYVTDSNVVNNMFFAHQIVPNSCATHALLSILLNCKSKKYLQLGDLLGKFQKICEGLSPDIKGLAIGNQPKLAEAHNSYAKPEPVATINSSVTMNGSSSRRSLNDPTSSTLSSSSASPSNQLLNSYSNTFHLTSSGSGLQSNSTSCSALNQSSSTTNVQYANEIFHFICFVPINGRLYELDGLKPYPVDHGPLNYTNNHSNSSNNYDFSTNHNSIDHTYLNNLLTTYLSSSYVIQSSSDTSNTLNWTNKFKQIIRQRLSSFNSGQNNHEIRFNLMAVVPDRMVLIREQIDLLIENKKILSRLLSDIQTNSYAQINDSSSPSSAPVSQQNGTNTESSNNSSINEAPVRQLRSCSSRTSLSNLVKQTPSPQTETQQYFDVILNLNKSHLINDLFVNNLKNPKNLLKFKCDLNKILFLNPNPNIKFDLIDFLKLFKIEFIYVNNNNNNNNNKTGISNNNNRQQRANDTIIRKCLNYILNNAKNNTEDTACLITDSDINDEQKDQSLNTNLNGNNTNIGDDATSSQMNVFDIAGLNDDPNLNYFLIRKSVSLNELKQCESKLQEDIDANETKHNEEIDKRKKYRADALRRKHIYDEFIVTYLKILAENGKLAEIVKNGLTTATSNTSTSAGSTSQSNSAQSSSNHASNASSIFLPQPIIKKQRKK